MKKFLLLLTFFLQFQTLAENIQGQEVLNNGELWQQENFMQNSFKKNLDILNKNLNRKNIVFDSCPSQRLPDNSNDQTNIVTALSKFVGNFQFWTYNAKSFYTKSEYNNLPCEMDITLLLHNFPEHLRTSDDDSVYWDKEMIAQRWQLASQSFKKCGIRIRNMTLTTFEFQGRYRDLKPDYNLSTAIKRIIPAPFHENNKIRGSKSVVVAYVKELTDNDNNPQRGDKKYILAALERDTAFIRRDAIYQPILPDGIDSNHKGFVAEAHEIGGHLLTNENNEQAHFNNRSDPNRYDVMSDLWSRASGTFTDEQCSKMLERGQDQGYLRCSMKFAKETSTTKNR